LSSVHGARLSAIARAQGLDVEDARDAVQEALSAFVALAEARDLCAASVDAAAFLTALTINVSRNMRRRHHRAKPHVRGAPLEALPDPGADLDELVARAECGRALDRCLGSLDEVPRKIVSLRIIEEVSGIEVANELDLSPGHVAVLLHRAKRSLSACLTRG
jgi:RNA polymerase sigma-70 factor, ECF subfamily